MLLLARRHARALGLLAGTGTALVLSAAPAHAAPAPVTGLAAALAPHGLQLTWTASGTGTPVVRDVTGLAEPYDPTSSGRLVPSGSTADCAAASCALDAGFSNTATATYAVWAADADGSTSSYASLTVAPLPPVDSTTDLDVPPATLAVGGTLPLLGHVTRGGQPLAGARVWLQSAVAGSSVVSTLAGLTSAADGSVSTGYAPVRTRSYWLLLPADAYTAGSSSAAPTVALQPRVSAGLSATTIPWKQSSVVRGAVVPGVSGATVAVQRWTGSAWSTLATRTLASSGAWALTVAPGVGAYHYRAVLAGAPSYLGAVSPVVTLHVVPRTLAQGLSGPDVLALEHRLTALHYDVGRVDGYFDSDLRHAVIAFQKVERLARTGTWTATDRARVLHPLGFALRHHVAGLEVEVDITRQVLVLARDGVIVHVVDVSTGSGAVYYQQGVRQVARTPRGAFRVYKKIDGIRISPLGELYKPSYFHLGFAIHGNGSVPVYPASHGCVRITIGEANRLFRVLAIGTAVYVYDE